MPNDPVGNPDTPKPLSRLEAMRKAAAAASDRPLNLEPSQAKLPDPRIKSERARKILQLAGEIAAEWRALGLTREQIAAQFALVAAGNFAAAAVPPKPSDRSAEARDARAKTRGRLPVGSWATATWSGVAWLAVLNVVCTVETIAGRTEVVAKSFTHSAPDGGLFRTLEELDIQFWEWFASDADKEVKAMLHFAPEPEAK